VGLGYIRIYDGEMKGRSSGPMTANVSMVNIYAFCNNRGRTVCSHMGCIFVSQWLGGCA